MNLDAPQKYSGFSLGMTVFAAGACMMCVQMAGGQTISPYFGSNVFVWGSVISVFMAGLSLGYVLGGRVADRRPSPMVLSLLLIAAGVSVILTPFYTESVNEALISINTSVLFRPLMPLLSVMALYFVPSMLLGMISPIAVRIASSALSTVGRSVGRLYAINALGSVTGTLIGTFVLVLFLGNRAILLTSGTILITVGIINFLLQRKLVVSVPQNKTPAETHVKAQAVPGLRPLVFTCGMMFMGLQILSGAQIAPFFGSSVFVWGSIIIVFLTAMTIGYRLGGKYADVVPTLPALSRIVAGAGVLTLLVPLITPSVCLGILSVPFGGGLNVLQPLVASFLLYFAPTVLFAMVAPYAVRISTSEVSKVGGVAGRLYALSTLGNLVGVLLTTFVLISAFGKTRLFEMAGLITVAVSVTAAIINSRSEKKVLPKKLLVTFAALAVILAFVTKPELVSLVSRHETVMGTVYGDWKLIKSPNYEEFYFVRRLVAQRESAYHHTAVIEQKSVPLDVPIKTDSGETFVPKNTVSGINARRDLRFDQYIQSSVILDLASGDIKKPYTSGTTYSDMLHLPFIFNRNIKDVLIIGGGGGVVPMIFRNAYDANIDVVEIDPIVVETAKRWFGFEPGEKLKVHVQDGRLFAHNSKKQYDLIILDAYTAGGRIPFHLTTREFIEVVKARLKPEGVVLMNVISAIEGKRGKLFRSEYKTFASVFGRDSVYVCPKYYDVPVTDMPVNIMLMATGSAHTKRLRHDQIVAQAQNLIDSKIVPVPTLIFHAGNMLNDFKLQNMNLSDVPVLTDDFAPVDFMVSHFSE